MVNHKKYIGYEFSGFLSSEALMKLSIEALFSRIGYFLKYSVDFPSLRIGGFLSSEALMILTILLFPFRCLQLNVEINIRRHWWSINRSILVTNTAGFIMRGTYDVNNNFVFFLLLPTQCRNTRHRHWWFSQNFCFFSVLTTQCGNKHQRHWWF